MFQLKSRPAPEVVNGLPDEPPSAQVLGAAGADGLAFIPSQLLWALGSICALHGKSFSSELVTHEFPVLETQTYTESTLIQASQRLGF